MLLKGLDGSLRYSVHKTSMELLLVPVPDGTRERVKPIIELVGNRGGQAAASLAILGLVAIGAANYATISAIVVLLAVLWLANVVTIRGNYLDVFRETLRAGGLSGKAELPDLDLGALELLFAGLNSTYDSEVLASLDILAEQHRERLIPALILYHPSRDVVLKALDLFAQIADAPTSSRSPTVSTSTPTVSSRPRRSARARRSLPIAFSSKSGSTATTARRSPSPRSSRSSRANGSIRADADRRLKEAIATRTWRAAAEIAARDPRNRHRRRGSREREPRVRSRSASTTRSSALRARLGRSKPTRKMRSKSPKKNSIAGLCRISRCRSTHGCSPRGRAGDGRAKAGSERYLPTLVLGC